MSLDARVRRSKISPTSSARKVRKALGQVFAKKIVMRRIWNGVTQLQSLLVRGHGKRQRFPQGQFFDQKYLEDHAEQLAKRHIKEEGRKAAQRTAAGAITHAESSKSAQRQAGAMPIEDKTIAWLASLADDI